MIIWISGPTGAGKTSLAHIFQQFGYALVKETIPPEAFSAFLSDPSKYCASLQEGIMRSRFDAWQNLTKSSQVVFDRSIDEDAQVFCRMHFESGFLEPDQYDKLCDLAKTLQLFIPVPDLILYMCPEKSILTHRMQQLRHPPLISQNLNRQVALYREWAAIRREEILRVDNSACKLQTVQRLFLEGSQC